MFEKIIGNDKIKLELTNSIKLNKILHSYMFIGNEGLGKNMMAKEFAKMILCENYNVERKDACNSCKSCIEFDSQNNPDYIYIEPDGRTIKIEQIRFMQNKVIEKPVTSTRKVYVINDADLMTREAQNCLLKTLEEPPEYITIILVVHSEGKMLNTIKSRCMKLQFNKIKDEELQKYMQQEYGINNLSRNILKLCDGSIGKCVELRDKIDEYKQIDTIIDNVGNSFVNMMSNAEILYKNKDDIFNYLDYLNVVLYEKSKEEYVEKLNYINSIKVVEETKQRILANANYDMCIDRLLLKIWEEINEKNCRS